MNTSGRGRIEKRLASAWVAMAHTAMQVLDAVREGDAVLAESLSVQLALDATRNAEALSKYDELPPRLRAFHRRQARRRK
jgi:hypothetical protein